MTQATRQVLRGVFEGGRTGRKEFPKRAMPRPTQRPYGNAVRGGLHHRGRYRRHRPAGGCRARQGLVQANEEEQRVVRDLLQRVGRRTTTAARSPHHRQHHRHSPPAVWSGVLCAVRYRIADRTRGRMPSEVAPVWGSAGRLSGCSRAAAASSMVANSKGCFQRVSRLASAKRRYTPFT